MRVSGLARKFWMITSPMWPCSSSSAFSASRASRRSARVSPMPIRIPLVNGIASSPASRIVSSRTAGTLSGDAQCGPPFSDSRSETVSSMIPIDADTGRSSSSSRPAHHARVQVRQQPGLVEHAAGAVREVLDRRREAELRELLARDAVAQLRLVAEREQRLRAAGGCSGAGDLEHLVDRQERALTAARRSRERAVAADIAAQRRQRDEDLGRVRDEAPAAQRPRLGHEVGKGRAEDLGDEVCHR